MEPVAAMPGAFRVQDRARRDLWLSWWDEAGSTGRPPVPEPLVVLSGRLADHFGAAGPEGRDDLPNQLLVADGDGALRLFDTLYEEADARFDLPRCQTLLDIVAGRQALLSPALERRYQDRVSYRRARGPW